MPQTVVRVFKTTTGKVPLKEWLDGLKSSEPRAYRKCLQRILCLASLGNEMRRPLADYLRDGIYELRIRVGTLNYRILYFFCGRDVACLSHGLVKKAAVPAMEIDLAVTRKGLVESNLQKHTADWEL